MLGVRGRHFFGHICFPCKDKLCRSLNYFFFVLGKSIGKCRKYVYVKHFSLTYNSNDYCFPPPPPPPISLDTKTVFYRFRPSPYISRWSILLRLPCPGKAFWPSNTTPKQAMLSSLPSSSSSVDYYAGTCVSDVLSGCHTHQLCDQFVIPTHNILTVRI